MNLPAWDEAQVSSRVKRFAFHAAVALLLLAGCSPDRLPYAGRPVVPTTGASTASGKTASVKSALILPTLPAVQDSTSGISRRADLHTYQPDRPRFEVYHYTVKEGDNLFSIAEQFDLQPQTILWSNLETLGDSPDALLPGQVLNILPVDGAYYQWHVGDGLNGVAKYFGVSPDDIVDWPGNHLDKSKLGDYAAPHIPPGTWLIIPGGRREFVDWTSPYLTRANPSQGSSIGSGACSGPIQGGAVGIGKYIWPTPEHRLSGYDYLPSINHWGIDIAGRLGDPIRAVDNGVVVFAGWSYAGYGNLIIIDHGDGMETYYAHLSQIFVQCGQSVWQTNIIGLMGSTGRSTGPHLHFEMRHGQWGHIDPWDYLPR